MMTKKQRALYWSAWSKAKKAIETQLDRKLVRDEVDQWRYRCHESAGATYKDIDGSMRVKSSKQLTNYDLDIILSVFFTWANTDQNVLHDRFLNQPITRCKFVAGKLCDQIQAALIKKGYKDKASAFSESNRDNYYYKTLTQMSGGRKLPTIAIEYYHEVAWHKLIAALSVHLRRVRKYKINTPAEATNNPF